MLDRFTYEVYIPSIDDSIRFYELDNTHYISIQKYIQNDDDVGLQEYFKHIISRLSTVDITHSMSRVDMFCILSDIRSYSIGGFLDITTTIDGIKAKGALSIPDIKTKIINQTKSLKHEDITVSPSIGITIGLPEDMFYQDINLFIYNCIKTVNIGTRSFNMSEYTAIQRLDVIRQLPGEVYNIINQYIGSVVDRVPTFSVSNNDNIPIDVNVLNNTMFELIKVLYTDDLKGIYDARYVLGTRISDRSYMAMTPGEANIFAVNYIKEQEEKNKQSESNSNVPSIGGMPQPT